MLRWLNFSAPCRRRAAAQWHNQDVNQAAEVLEVRAVPAKPGLGAGEWGAIRNQGPVNIHIYPKDDKKQYVDVNIPETGAFTCTVNITKKGIFLNPVKWTDIGGRIKITPNEFGDYAVDVKVFTDVTKVEFEYTLFKKH